MTDIHLERAGTRLSCRDFGGSGLPVLLLHGLAGHAGEWNATAGRLASDYHVVALDQRGHGDSERVPGDVSREAFVADVAAVIDTLGLGSVVLVGQSMGANTAMLVAAEHPALVRALVVAEGSPDGPQGYVARPDVAVSIENPGHGMPTRGRRGGIPPRTVRRQSAPHHESLVGRAPSAGRTR